MISQVQDGFGMESSTMNLRLVARDSRPQTIGNQGCIRAEAVYSSKFGQRNMPVFIVAPNTTSPLVA